MFIIPDASQVSQLIQELQSLAKAAGHKQPLLIGLELEGGLVRKEFSQKPFVFRICTLPFVQVISQ